MIYLCIPAHNEEQTVGVVLWKIRQVLTEFPRDYQILVADDASTDRTADVLAPYARVLPLTVLRTRERRGYAASLEMLLREAADRSPYPKRDTIITLQADFTDEPDDIVPLIKQIEQGADIVGGMRASDTRPELVERWLLRWQQWMLRRIQWPENAGDPLTGFRAYRVSVITRALEEAGEDRLLTWDGQAADAELLRVAAPHARRVESIDLVHRPDRRQRASRTTTWERTKVLRRFARGRQPETTIPLAALAPETVPPPRPVEVERARRTEAANGAPEPRRRNGRGRSGTGRTQAGRPERGGERKRASTEAGSSTGQRKSGSATSRRRKRSGVTDSGTGSTRQQPDHKPAGEPAATQAENTAPAGAPQGNEGSPAAEAGAAPKKRRRRRRRKPASQRSQSQGQEQAGSEPTADAGDGVSKGDDQSGTAAVSQGTTNGSADEGGTGAPKKRRRRGGRRGGRGRRRKSGGDAQGGEASAQSDAGADGGSAPAAVGGEPDGND